MLYSAGHNSDNQYFISQLHVFFLQISYLRGACDVPIVENQVRLLSRGMDTDQSSTGWNGDSSRAVDGNPSGNYWHQLVQFYL